LSPDVAPFDAGAAAEASSRRACTRRRGRAWEAAFTGCVAAGGVPGIPAVGAAMVGTGAVIGGGVGVVGRPAGLAAGPAAAPTGAAGLRASGPAAIDFDT